MVNIPRRDIPVIFGMALLGGALPRPASAMPSIKWTAKDYKVEWISGNVFIRPQNLPDAGRKVVGHRHNFDHTTIVFSGSVNVKAVLPDGQVVDRNFSAPSHFLVKADVEHEITAIHPSEEEARSEIAKLSRYEIEQRLVAYMAQPTQFWCVYSHRTPQGDIVQEWTGWEPAVV